MLRNKYRAFEIRDDQVSQTLVDGNLCSIAEFIRHCDEGSIITLHTMEGEPFLIGLSKMFVFCGDKDLCSERDRIFLWESGWLSGRRESSH